MSTSPPPPNFCSVLSESKRIVLAHRRHYFGLSLLFLLPLSFFGSIHSTLQNLLTSSQLHHHSLTTTTTVSILLPLTYDVIAISLSLLAIGSISFSAYHGFFGRPVELVSSILSLLRSFLPLLLTSLASLLIRVLVFFAFGFVLFLIVIGFQLMGFEIDQSSPLLILFCVIIVVLLLLVLVYLQVNWALALVVVVVESSRGFEPLRRSTKLIKGIRGLTLSLMLFYGFCAGSWALGCRFIGGEYDGNIWSWKSWSFVLRTVLSTAGVMLMMLQYIVITTVLYVYSKAVHGETAEEFDGEYASLPFDDGKVSHVVSV